MTRYKVAPFIKPAKLTAGFFAVKTVVDDSPPIDRPAVEDVPTPVKVNPYTIEDASYKSYIPLDPPRRNAKTGKMEKVMVIFHHIAHIRRDSWGSDTFLTVKRHRNSVNVTYPNGEKDRSTSRTMAGVELAKRFGEDNARQILALIG